MSNPGKVFLLAELQISMPFTEEVWREANPAMQKVPGLISKTWLSGIDSNSVGGFYEFDSMKNARAYADGMLAQFAKRTGAQQSVKFFDGDVVSEASRGMSSPFFRDPAQ